MPHESAARESQSRRVLCTPYNHAPCHFIQSHIRKVYACLAVTCHLRFWQNDRDLLRATAVTRGWNGYRNKSQHRKLTLEKKILPPLQQGFEPATFRSRVRRSNHTKQSVLDFAFPTVTTKQSVWGFAFSTVTTKRSVWGFAFSTVTTKQIGVLPFPQSRQNSQVCCFACPRSTTKESGVVLFLPVPQSRQNSQIVILPFPQSRQNSQVCCFACPRSTVHVLCFACPTVTTKQSGVPVPQSLQKSQVSGFDCPTVTTKSRVCGFACPTVTTNQSSVGFCHSHIKQGGIFQITFQFKVDKNILVCFYQTIIQSAMLYNQVCHFGNSKKADTERLDKVARTAAKIVGAETATPSTIYGSVAVKRLHRILSDTQHPLNHVLSSQVSH